MGFVSKDISIDGINFNTSSDIKTNDLKKNDNIDFFQYISDSASGIGSLNLNNSSENNVNVITEELDLSNVSENISNLFNHSSETEPKKTSTIYDQLKELFNKDFDVSGLPDDYRMQSFTVTNEYVYVSAYDHNHDRKDNSILMIYDKDGNYLGNVLLPTCAHVGGISYDSKDDILFITDSSGNVIPYNNNKISREIEYEISENNFGEDGFNIDLINSGHNLTNKSININDTYYDLTGNESSLAAATTYYKDGKLYVATFGLESKVFVYNVSRNSSGEINYIYDTSYGISDKMSAIGIQGLSTYTDSKGNQYILFSSSYSKAKSIISKYKVTDSGLEFAGMQSFEDVGLEAIYIDDDGNIYGNFENLSYGSDGSNHLISNVDDINRSFTDEEIMYDYSVLYYFVKEYEQNK